ncbi:hypothetical protein HKX48_004781 [Thoreauomyces humboldtii]|nr:hypothetical protein HKX48_004781 [Thoreauomyces humboldtii]
MIARSACRLRAARVSILQRRALSTPSPPAPAPAPAPSSPPIPRPGPPGKTIRPSAVPSTPHPYTNQQYQPNYRLLTFLAGATLGGIYYLAVVHADAPAPPASSLSPSPSPKASTDEQPTVLPAVFFTTKELAQDRVPVDQIAAARGRPGLYLWGAGIRQGTVFEVPLTTEVARDVALGKGHAACVDANGDLVQWVMPTVPSNGRWDGRTGERVEDVVRPRTTIVGGDLVQVVCTEAHVYAVSRKGRVYRVVKATDSDDATPVRVREPAWWWPFGSDSSTHGVTTFSAENGPIDSLAAGPRHVLGVTTRGRAVSTSSDEASVAGTLPSWKQVEGLEDIGKVAQVACGAQHSLVRSADGRVFGYGDNTFGQLAQDIKLTTLSTPTQLTLTPPSARCTSIAAGGNTTLLTLRTTTSPSTDVAACGTGLSGQLGDGTWSHVTARGVQPVRSVSGLTEWHEDDRTIRGVGVRNLAVAVGGGHCGIVVGGGANGGGETAGASRGGSWFGGRKRSGDDGLLYGADVMLWGANGSGQLARNDGKKTNSPVPVHPFPIAYAEEGRFSEDGGRMQVALAGDVKVKGKTVRAEQRMVLGEGVTGVYMRAI